MCKRRHCDSYTYVGFMLEFFGKQFAYLLTRYQLPHRQMPFSPATSQYGKTQTQTPFKTAKKSTQRRMDSRSSYTASRMLLLAVSTRMYHTFQQNL